ncbi:heavy metal sensor histidine kinase [Paraburkholderia ultramafica]|nr:heavy metal sensor histidine kinase [Paraburkholderia ultramafica]
MTRRMLPITLRARLAVLVALSMSVFLALSELALYESLRNRIDLVAAEQMHGMMSALQAHLRAAHNVDEVARDTPRWIDPLHGHRNMDLAIVDSTGQALVTTAAFVRDPQILARRTIERPITIDSEDGKLRYLVFDAPLGESSIFSTRVAIQYDRSADLALLHHHAYTIVVIEVLGIVVAAAFAYGIATFGLSPLRRLISRAEEMSTSRLAHPLPSLDTSGELKELELAFNGMLSRLNESFTRLSQFSSNLAHDMRTPLTNLQAAAQVALSQPRLAEDYREVIESSIDEYQRLSRMIEDMLFLARSDSAESPIKVCRLDANVEAGRVAGFYEAMAEDAGITVRVEGQASVDAELLLFQRALSNLLSNALVSAPRGSEVIVKCVGQADGTTIEVSDVGKGIASEHTQKLFDRFYRIDPSRHNSASGTGLGLAIVRSIMDLHQGQCGVNSAPGVLTTFWLLFPKRA